MAESFKPLKGMLKDTGRMDQVDGTYRDALNLIVDDLKLNVANEYGTISVGTLNVSVPTFGGGVTSVSINAVGQIALLDDNFIIFGSGEFTTIGGAIVTVSTIHKVNVAIRSASILYYTTNVVSTSPGTINPLGHLNFDVNHPVTAELRESPIQEEIIYFTDNKYTFITDPATNIEYVSEYNPPRVFNVTKQEASVSTTIDPTNLYGNFSRVEFLNLFMDAGQIPEFDDITILRGGGVITGAYYLGVGYADDDRTETNVLTVSNPVYIVPANDDSFPRETISGAPNGTQTSKSIQWRLTNLNQEYRYLVPYVVQYSGNARFVYKLENVNIVGSSVDVIYSGLEKVSTSAIEEAVIDKVRYLTAKSITQLDNKLYAANLTSRPDLGYQRFANNIKIEPVVELVTSFDPRRYDVYTLNEGYSQLVYPDPRLNLFSWTDIVNSVGNDVTGMFGWITGRIRHTQFKALDGVSEAYVTSIIIPIQQAGSAGYRDPNILFKKKGYRRGEVYSFYISFVLKDGSETFAYHIPGREMLEAFEDDWTSFETGVGSNLGAIGLGIKTGEIKSYDPNARVYQYFDTSYMGTIPSRSNMGYWQNLNEFYPDDENFQVWGVDSTGQSVYVSTLANTHIRHHKMPSNHNSRYSHVVGDTYFGDIPLDDPLYTANADGYRVFNDRVRILGIKLTNLKIPKFILNQVQGYKVYYAKRTQGNKTIIGQSGAHPSTSYLASNLSNNRENVKTGPFFNIWSLDGDLKYGGLATSDTLWTQDIATLVANGLHIDNIKIPLTPEAGGNNQINYVGNPVFKFHDFNLLRKRPTIATATHIDIQYVCLMESWRGGYKGATRSQIPEATTIDTYNKYYRGFRSGIGEDTHCWVHEDLGNMINFNEDDPESIYYDNPGPKILWGNVYIAARYATPGSVTDSTGNKIDTGIVWYDRINNFGDDLQQSIVERYIGDINVYPNMAVSQSALLSNTQTVLMIEQDGATYVNGLSILKSATSTGFKGATYLYNAFGESAIAISLASGLPMLGGYQSNEWSYIGLSNLMWSLRIYGKLRISSTSIIDPHTNPGNADSLYSGHDINFNRGDIVQPGGTNATSINNASIWYYNEDIFLSMMMKGHSSLRQPYNIETPPSSLTTAGTSITLTIVLQAVSLIPSDPLYGYGRVDSTVGEIDLLTVGATVISSCFPGNNRTIDQIVYIEDETYVSLSTNINPLDPDPSDTYPCAITITLDTDITTTSYINNNVKARPNTYLINLCSNKTDVFEPFDKQQLVWTGYYKSLLNVDLDTGVDTDGNNYYSNSLATSESGDIFGGDTYICKYSYRTTSNLYGLGRFKKGVNQNNINRLTGYNPNGMITSIHDDTSYLFGDIPLDLSTGKTPGFGTNIYTVTSDYNVLYWGGGVDNPGTDQIEGAGNEFTGARKNAIQDVDNWSTSGYEVFTTIYQYMVESDDNINYRHAGDPEKGVSEINSMYFDKYVAADVLYRSPLGDLTKMDNMLYEDHYSALQDIRVPIAFPKESANTLAFPNRVIRSATQDGNFNDTYRYFLGLQYKDFAVNKGPITNIFNLKALLYIHTERSLFRTKGKQNIELGDATQAYIGSGDLFAQEPDEFIQSIEGYNGLYNKMGALVTKDGYIFVARKSRKIFLVKDEVIDLTQLGINAWARENIPFALEAYGWDPDYAGIPTDAPTGDFGFLVSYDPLFKRTLITKRELVPTQLFIDEFTQGSITYSRGKATFNLPGGALIPLEVGQYFEKGGWTVSFSNSLSVWASRHSYIPLLYGYNSKYMYSFSTVLSPGGLTSSIYEHSDISNPGRFYGTVYNFEIDCIFTAPVNAVYSGFKYTADVFTKFNTSLPVEQQFSPGFTSFYVYNTAQISGEIDFVYLNNIRKTDNTWNVNAFRDLSKIVSNSGLAVGQINVQGVPYTSTSAQIATEPMFLSEGIINSNYIDSNKPWYEQRKFVDKFLGIRLIANNLSKNLINLYTVTAALRVSPR
jgi:hypothetical protein